MAAMCEILNLVTFTIDQLPRFQQIPHLLGTLTASTCAGSSNRLHAFQRCEQPVVVALCSDRNPKPGFPPWEFR
jgi:hypothetical protein